VSSEIGERKTSRAPRGWAWAALLALLVYQGGRGVAHQRAVDMAASRLYEGSAPRTVAALPVGMNPLIWRGVIKGDGFAIIVPIDVSGEFDPAAGRLYRESPAGPAVEAAMRTRPFQVFSRFSQLPFRIVTPVENGVQVRIMDLRFGTPDNPGFAGVTAVVDDRGNVLESRAGF
jgi:hypothetical protein